MWVPEKVYRGLDFDWVRAQVAAQATSPQGRERALAMKTLPDLNEVTRELSCTLEMQKLLGSGEHFPIAGAQDLGPALRRAAVAGSKLEPGKLLAIAATLRVGQTLRRQGRKLRESYPHIGDIIGALADQKELLDRIDKTLDQAEKLKDEASLELKRLRRHQGRVRAGLEARLNALADDLTRQGYLQERVVTIRNGRLVLPVKSEHRRRLPGVLHDQSATGATSFIEPLETLEQGNQLRHLTVAITAEEDRILRSLTGAIRQHLFPIQKNVDLLGRLDFIYAKARFANRIGAQPPILKGNGPLRIKGGRHPLLWSKIGEGVVPLDLEVEDGVGAVLITGPNAGGKTVAIKTVGLLVLMAASGLPIPAHPSSYIPPFNGLFVHLGDEQSIEEDLSTFTSHVINLKEMLGLPAGKNLILIDEIGTGTDPEAGAALAQAVLEKLLQTGSLTIASTHHARLKAFAASQEGIVNGAMEFDAVSLKPTYRFQLGLPGGSHTFEISERVGLDPVVVGRARHFLGRQQGYVEDLIVDLEKKRQHYEGLGAGLSRKQSELEGLVKLYRERLKELERETEVIKRKAVEEAQFILAEVNRRVEGVIKNIKEKSASRESIQRAKQSISAVKHEIENQEKALKREKSNLSRDQRVEIGDWVRVEEWGEPGRILALDGKKALVGVGSVKVWVGRGKILDRTVGADSIPAGVPKPLGILLETLAVSPQINLRRLTFDEARDRLEKYLNDSLLAGLEKVCIIHGKGTGALREKVGSYLKSHPLVKDTRPGGLGEGDAGVTIVTLR